MNDYLQRIKYYQHFVSKVFMGSKVIKYCWHKNFIVSSNNNNSSKMKLEPHSPTLSAAYDAGLDSLQGYHFLSITPNLLVSLCHVDVLLGIQLHFISIMSYNITLALAQTHGNGSTKHLKVIYNSCNYTLV